MSIWKGLLKTFKTRAAEVYAAQKAQGLPKNAKHSRGDKSCVESRAGAAAGFRVLVLCISNAHFGA